MLAPLPAILQSSFRRFRENSVGPWMKPFSKLSETSTSAPVLAFSALAWSHLVYALTKTTSPKAPASWIFRKGKGPFALMIQLLVARAPRWSQNPASAADPVKRQNAKVHAKALALAFASIVYGLTVNIRDGASSRRDDDAPIDASLCTARIERYDYMFAHLLQAHLPQIAKSTVSTEVNALAWSILANIVRPRTLADRDALLETLVNPIFLDLPFSDVSSDSPRMEHLLAVGMQRAIQPSQIPGWGAQWVGTKVERVLKLFSECLPDTDEVPPLVRVRCLARDSRLLALIMLGVLQDNMTLAWQSLMRNLVTNPKSLRIALAWLVQLTRKRPSIAGEFWAVTVARSETPVIEAVAEIAATDVAVVEAATKAWLSLHEKPQAPASALGRCSRFYLPSCLTDSHADQLAHGRGSSRERVLSS